MSSQQELVESASVELESLCKELDIQDHSEPIQLYTALRAGIEAVGSSGVDRKALVMALGMLVAKLESASDPDRTCFEKGREWGAKNARLARALGSN